MEYVTLSNGIKMPKIGFGVFQIPKQETKQCVLNALKNGYRHIDTAQAYYNEEEVGQAIVESNVDRSELFITTKVWVSNYENAKESILNSLNKLKVEYIDLVLIHQPFGNYYKAYRDLVSLYQEGKIKAFGVSNFSPDRLADIYGFNEIKPMVNQIEINPFNQQKLAYIENNKRNVQLQAWAPLAQGNNQLFENPILKTIASKHNKTIAQVVLRWLTQKDIVALVKSVNENRMIENINIFDFKLDESDLKQIESLDANTPIFDHKNIDNVEWFINAIKTNFFEPK